MSAVGRLCRLSWRWVLAGRWGWLARLVQGVVWIAVLAVLGGRGPGGGDVGPVAVYGPAQGAGAARVVRCRGPPVEAGPPASQERTRGWSVVLSVSVRSLWEGASSPPCCCRIVLRWVGSFAAQFHLDRPTRFCEKPALPTRPSPRLWPARTQLKTVVLRSCNDMLSSEESKVLRPRPIEPPLPIPSGYDPPPIPCPVCGTPFAPTGKKQYCTTACRVAAHRRRKRAAPMRVTVPADRPRRPITVYECPTCETRALGVQRCEDCGAFMAKIGVGGHCPHCFEPVALADLVGPDFLPDR